MDNIIATFLGFAVLVGIMLLVVIYAYVFDKIEDYFKTKHPQFYKRINDALPIASIPTGILIVILLSYVIGKGILER